MKKHSRNAAPEKRSGKWNALFLSLVICAAFGLFSAFPEPPCAHAPETERLDRAGNTAIPAFLRPEPLETLTVTAPRTLLLKRSNRNDPPEPLKPPYLALPVACGIDFSRGIRAASFRIQFICVSPARAGPFRV